MAVVICLNKLVRSWVFLPRTDADLRHITIWRRSFRQTAGNERRKGHAWSQYDRLTVSWCVLANDWPVRMGVTLEQRAVSYSPDASSVISSKQLLCKCDNSINNTQIYCIGLLCIHCKYSDGQ